MFFFFGIMMRVADCGLIITTMSKEETLVVGSSSSCKEGRTRSVTTEKKNMFALTQLYQLKIMILL